MAKLGFKDFLNVDYAPGEPDQIKKNAKRRKVSDVEEAQQAELEMLHRSSRRRMKEDVEPLDEVSKEGTIRVIDLARQKNPTVRKHLNVDKAGNKGYQVQRMTKGKFVNQAKPYSKLKDAQKAQHSMQFESLDEVLSTQQRLAKGRKMRILAPRIALGRKRAMKRAADPKRLKSRAKKQARNTIFKKLSKGVSRSDMSPARRAEIEKRINKMGNRIDRLAIKLLPTARKMDRDRRASANKSGEKK